MAVDHFGMGQVHFDEVHDGEVRGDLGLYGVGMVLLYGDMEQTRGDMEQSHGDESHDVEVRGYFGMYGVGMDLLHGDMEQSHDDMEQSHGGVGQMLKDQRKS